MRTSRRMSAATLGPLVARPATAFTTSLRACFSTGNSSDDVKHYPSSGLAYMDGIRNFNKEIDPSAFKPDRVLTIKHAKAMGFEVHVPVREYYDPPHWKAGKSHLLMSLEFDMVHIWARPPDGAAFPVTPLAALTADEQKAKWPHFVPMMQKLTVVEDDWIITDFYTMFNKTPVWVVPAFERFLDVNLHPEGTSEYDKMVTPLDSKALEDDEAGWVGQGFFRKHAHLSIKSSEDSVDSDSGDEDQELNQDIVDQIEEGAKGVHSEEGDFGNRGAK
jgi:hypothetical protein